MFAKALLINFKKKQKLGNNTGHKRLHFYIKISRLTCRTRGLLTAPDWALGMAKHAGTHSAAQQTKATFPHLICKAIPLPSHSVHLFVISMSRLHWLCLEESMEPGLKETLLPKSPPSPKKKENTPNPLSQHTLTSPPAWLMCPDTRTSPVNWPNELSTAPA